MSALSPADLIAGIAGLALGDAIHLIQLAKLPPEEWQSAAAQWPKD